MGQHAQTQTNAAAQPSARAGQVGILQRQCSCGQHTIAGEECEECRQQRDGTLQPAAISSPPVNTVPPVVHEVLDSPGQPLDAGTRSFMEPRFGYDFSQVRVHTDEKAAESAQAVNALAYTVGRDVVFGEGEYKPTTTDGRRLLAHELTHVMQQGSVSHMQYGITVSQPDDASEQQAGRIAEVMTAPVLPNEYSTGAVAERPNYSIDPISHRVPQVQREPTQPRAATGTRLISDLTKQTAKSSTGRVTAGSLAAQEWESLFRRHFTEPDKVMDEVESSHARYLYSRIYGWIDAQHFFAHIQFAEESGLEGATEKGIKIEQQQERIRKLIAPSPGDQSFYADLLENNLLSVDDFLHYGGDDLVLALGLALDFLPLTKQQKDLIKGFSEEQLAKFILDNAFSAWSYEDLVSNELGVQFFRLYGKYVNDGESSQTVRQRFIDKITEFFVNIQVVNNPATVRTLAAKLPGKERWTAPKMSLKQAQKKFPELFEFGNDTHRIRIGVYDTEAGAERGKSEVEKITASFPRLHLHIAQYGQKSYALYTNPMGHFETVVLKWMIDHTIPTGRGGALIERKL